MPSDHGRKEAADPTARAREICLRQLETRPRSHAELATTLGRRGVDPDTAEAVLARLIEVGLVDDKAFATALISSARANRSLGRRGLVHELRRRGVDVEVASVALADLDTLDTYDEEAAARELVRRRMPAMDRLSNQVRARRLTALLDRRGYHHDLVVRVVTEELTDGSLD
ncbi:regulatory protein RecX [Candidatus Protofrankia californiensis]|uniref:regulatory protein RecX n=1 Tax=Candidatus Protofrankia californiensis TaxID=1839754 RepID=UPI0010413673|nr:regulatory protein RecX [Candidatus Protofrankia californiensis]